MYEVTGPQRSQDCEERGRHYYSQPMPERVHYEGYVITSTPEPVRASEQWKVRIAIYWKVSGVLKMQLFSGPTLYENEEESDKHGVAYGQRLINEKVPGLKTG